jgi:O-antigen ligase
MACCVLFISLHLNIGGRFVESHAVFYVFATGIILLASVQKNKFSTVKINAGYLAVLSLLLLYLTNFIAEGNPYGMHVLYSTLICMALFFVFRFLFIQNRHFIKWLSLCVIVSITIEIAFGFGQLFGFINNDSEFFRLGGSFGNPSAFGAYLGIVLPLVLSLILSYARIKKAENLYYAFIAIFVFSLFLLFLSKSRAAWLAAGLGCSIVLNYRYSILQTMKSRIKGPLKKSVAIISVATIILSSAFVLYKFKEDSADGRLLVWKVIADTRHDNLLFGNGTGYVEANYGKWQADCFMSGKGSESERYVADYVTCSYNEFIETGLEQGIIAVLLFIMVFYLALKQKITSLFALGAKASLIALIVVMFASYPLKVSSIYLYLVFCLAVIFNPSQKDCLMKIKIFRKF